MEANFNPFRLVKGRQIPLLVLAAGAGFGLAFFPASSEQDQRISIKASGGPARIGAGETGVRDDPVATLFGALAQGGDFRQLAELGSTLGKLDSAQIAALMNRLDRPGVENRGAIMARIMAWWTRRDPDAATVWMKPRLAYFLREPFTFTRGLQRSYDEADVCLVQSWAKHAGDAVLDFARSHPDNDLSGMLLWEAVGSHQEKSFADRFEILRRFPGEKQRRRVQEALFPAWAKENYGAAVAAAAGLPEGVERNVAVAQVLGAWTGHDPEKAFAQFTALGVETNSVATLLTLRAAKEDPAATARWLESLSTDQLASCGKILVAAWAKSDPEKAFSWALANGVSLTQEASLQNAVPGYTGWDSPWWDQQSSGSPLREAARAHPGTTVEWLRTLPAGPERERLCELAILANPKSAELSSLLTDLSPDAIPRAIRSIVAFSRGDEERLEQLQSQLPAGAAREAYWRERGVSAREPLPDPTGPDRDAMLTGIIWRSGETPAQAWSLLQQIEDPQRRMNAFDDMMYKLRPQENDRYQTDALERHEAFRQWLGNPDVPDEWKTSWLPFLKSASLRTTR